MSNDLFPANIKGLTWTVLRTQEFSTIAQKSPSAQAVRIRQYQNPVWKWELIWDYLYGFWAGPNNQQKYGPGYTDVKVLMGFVAARAGSFDDFLYNEPDDNTVGPATVTTAWKPLTYYNAGFSILDSGGHWQQASAITTGISGATVPTFDHSGGTVVDSGVTWHDMGSGFSGGVPNSNAQLQLLTDGLGRYFSPIQRNLGGQFFEDVTDLNPPAPAAAAITVCAAGVTKTQGTDYTVGGPGLAIPGASFTGLYIAWIAPPAWLADWAYALNFEILDPNGNIQKVTTAGTSGATIPTFNVTTGQTTADGTGSLVWTNEGPNPPPAAPITAGFNFLWRVTFDGDSQDFEQTMQQLWTIGGGSSKNGNGYLKLVTARPPSENGYNFGVGACLLYGLGTVNIEWPDIDGSTTQIVMDGQGNATITWISGGNTQAPLFGYGNVLPVGPLAPGPASIGSDFTLGEELIIMYAQSGGGAIYYFTGPGSRNSGSVTCTLVNIG